ncbi:LOW QUALITY PROTEIN: sorting nexin-21 [Trachemys scripta elegans]|uniref:LOW QUALITY PROTEIN: sorting nexin-21 n=1 Tax=Trachemys scripta elegans TaxID=31138 RepID=UPI001552DB1E|nr:LOW QUALITY PROTEIN: sorting nexin-21 [Trachemys scripta elegans]
MDPDWLGAVLCSGLTPDWAAEADLDEAPRTEGARSGSASPGWAGSGFPGGGGAAQGGSKEEPRPSGHRSLDRGPDAELSPMAFRLMHRLRHALAGEGDLEGQGGGGSEVEEFPESSELEDDTDGLSTRLSGTLSFTSNEEEEEAENEEAASQEMGDLGELGLPKNPGAMENGDPSPAPAERQGSNLLTRQLQDFWRRSRSSFVPQRLLFEVTSTSVVSERSSKYVLYTIYLIRSGQFDKAPAAIARRYSDFERLNRRLRHRFGCDMAGVSFPRKRLRRNFTAETIAKRSRAFEQFLSHLYSIAEIRRSSDFLEFFFLRDLQAAQRLTCTGMYGEALATWSNAYRLQDKLGVYGSGRFLLTLAGLVVCHQELDEPSEAHRYCERALVLLEAQDRHPLLEPFLQAHIHLSWKVGKDKRQSEARLQRLQGTGVALQQQPTLKEFLIKEALD